jgi:hypothetical protein
VHHIKAPFSPSHQWRTCRSATSYLPWNRWGSSEVEE